MPDLTLTDVAPAARAPGAELEGTGNTIEQMIAAQVSEAMRARPVTASTDPAELKHEIELMRERINALVAVLVPYYRNELQSFAPLD